MKLGKILSFMSPALGMATGNGMGFLPYLSPGLGMLTGKGPFGKMVGGEDQQQPQAAPQQIPGAMGQPPAMPTGMFGASQPAQQMGGMDPQLLRYLMSMRGY